MDDTHERLQAILNAPTYRLAAQDVDLLARPELRPLRLQLEFLKPELAFIQEGIRSTIVVFGGTRIVEHAHAEARLQLAEKALAADPGSSHLARDVARARRVLELSVYYDHAREFSRIASTYSHDQGEFVICTGGGPGIMEAANRGAFEVGAKSIGLNITLPAEQQPNSYITPQLCFQFHYFALRKLHFVLRAKALVAFPGGFGTLDELFEVLTLRQTHRMQKIPVILFGRGYWEQAINCRFLADSGTIDDADLDLLQYAETPAEAWDIISLFHGFPDAAPEGNAAHPNEA